VVLRFRSSHLNVTRALANFGIGPLVDTNILVDIATNDPRWAHWALHQLDAAAIRGPVLIMPLSIPSSLSHTRESKRSTEFLAEAGLELTEIPRSALFLAGKAFQRYRAFGGSRTGVLPDFFIGAHAAVTQFTLLTRDPRRYSTYFSGIALIAPKAT
jgi:predicted nucleic acid-binding protein